MKRTRTGSVVLDVVTSLKLTIVCLAALMVLVVSCTLAQVKLGTFGAVELYMRSFFLWIEVPGTSVRVPYFPGGATVGLVLAVNLVAAQLKRLELSWKKSGIWLAHIGLILLVAGEFISGALQVDTQLAVEEGQTVNFIESPRDLELAVIDETDPAYDDVFSIPSSRLARGGTIEIPGTPVALRVERYYRNSHLSQRQPQDPPPPVKVDGGIGESVTVRELPPVSRDDEVNRAAAYVQLTAGARTQTFLVSNGLAAPQSFVHDGRTYRLEMRSRREYLPYAVTLKDFKHDVYPGTSIPKNFSSLVRVTNPSRGEARDVLIYMNQPLRYEGKTFYQASFGKDDTLSILQVVENPGWVLPYVSTVLVTLGLLVQFGITLARSVKKRQAEAEA